MKAESLYECLLRVPLVITAPDGVSWPRNDSVSGLVDLTDLFATILDIAGVPAPEYAQCKSLLPWTQIAADNTTDVPPPLHEMLFAQAGDYEGHLKTTTPSGLPESGRRNGIVQGARNANVSVIRDPDFGEEVYDLETDPGELTNLAGGTYAQTDAVENLRREISAWETGCKALRSELGVVPGYRGFDT
jgi:arylsulfatase A-like enzyme